MKIRVCIPSYKRTKVETLDYIPDARVYVDESEYQAYVEANPGADIVSCKKGIQGNLCRIRNHIMRSEFEQGTDVVCIVDDDMEGLYLWEKSGETRMEKIKITHDWLYDFLEKYSILCDEFGFKFWGGNCNQDAMSYRAYTPFSLVSYIGGPFQVFLKGNTCFYDERLPLKEDYDMTLQQCNKYRGCLRLNMLTYNVKQSEQAGGCASYRNMENERKQFELLQRKWGKDIVREDRSNKGHSSKTKSFDYNPIIHIPIKGV